MKNPRWFALFSLIRFSAVGFFFLSGCGPAAVRTPLVKDVSVKEIATAEPVRVSRENLSMAKELKNVVPGEYVLGPEDMVEISVFRQEELKMNASISSSGLISYYLIGDIQAAGLTQFQLRDKVQKELRKFIKAPHVIVRITEYRSHRIVVLGQVRNPGVYRMRSSFSLLEAISASGGITPDAYLGGAYVVRAGEVILVNFFELIEKGNTQENIPLLSGDVIYIPDNRDQKVYVLGEVNRQAAIPLGERLSLLEAIAEAGGFTKDAEKESIIIMRGNLSEPQIMKIDAERMEAGANIPLERGDIVYVASSSFANVERVALRISHILQPFLSVTRGIILQDAAVDVLKGKDTRYVVGD